MGGTEEEVRGMAGDAVGIRRGFSKNGQYVTALDPDGVLELYAWTTFPPASDWLIECPTRRQTTATSTPAPEQCNLSIRW